MNPLLSILIPASNEASLIGQCLTALLASDALEAEVEVIVVVNGSNDATASIAQSFKNKMAKRQWELHVLDLEKGGKINALNVGDKAAHGPLRIYLDADVVVSKPLLGRIFEALNTPKAVYSSGQVKLTPAQNIFTRAYGRIYQSVPFMTTGVPGCGLFAVNAAGRKRWADFPNVISDDTFVRLQFSAQERKIAGADYDWPLVEGLANLIRVRRRQDAGVAELIDLYPALFENDDKPHFGLALFFKLALKDPLGMAVYGYVALAVRLTKNRAKGDWSRGR